MNTYKEHLSHIKGNVVEIRIPEIGMVEALPMAMDIYKQLLQDLNSPEAVSEVILELVAVARLQGADISEEKIIATESELLNIYLQNRPKPQEKFG